MTTANHNCVYKNCLNTKRRNKGISFFKFPITDGKRTQEWQKNCGNLTIALMDINDLKYKLICEVHFSQNYIVINNKRKLLTKNAIPIQFIEKDNEKVPNLSTPSTSSCVESVGEHVRTYSRNSATKSSVNSPTSNNSECSSKVIEGIVNTESPTKCLLQKPKQKLIKKNILARKKNTSFSVESLLGNLLMNRSRFVKTFIKMQLCRKRNRRWNKDEQQLALSLYCKSPRAYKFMMYSLKFLLPSMESIQKWLKESNLNTK